MSQYLDESAPAPYVAQPSEAPAKEILNLPTLASMQWLQRGWQDLCAQPAISLFFGVAFWGMAMVLGMVFRNSPEYTMTMVSGCLLIGPFLALGLYEVSRRRELDLRPSFISSMTSWKNHLRSMGMLVGVLIVIELLWGRASLVVIALFFNSGMPSTVGVMQSITNPENLEFLIAYLAVGGVFASLVFAISVVSIPMILDRDTDAISAAIISIAVVLENAGAMVLWGAVIVALIGASLMLPWSIGLLLTGPLLGHASWHAYRNSMRWLQT
jgi:uncharacterized membrane protein